MEQGYCKVPQLRQDAMHQVFNAQLPAGRHLVAVPDTPPLLLLSLQVALRVELLQQRSWSAGNLTPLHTAKHYNQGTPTVSLQALVPKDDHLRDSATDTERFS